MRKFRYKRIDGVFKWRLHIWSTFWTAWHQSYHAAVREMNDEPALRRRVVEANVGNLDTPSPTLDGGL